MVLHYKVFFSKRDSATRTGPAGHDHLKWVPTSSTMIYGDKDAVLVDGQLTTKASHELLDWVVESGKNITHVYVTHAHGDHFFGSAPILERFPRAVLVATPEVVARMRLETTPERLTGLWEKFFPNQIPPALRVAQPLEQDYLELEGEKLLVVKTGHTDTDDTTTLWVPCIKLAVTGDAVYANTHPYLGESGTAIRRNEWIAALDTIAALQPKHVVGGHSDPKRRYGPEAVQDTKTYLENFEKLSGETKTAEELYARIMEIYPERLNPGSLWAGAILVHQP
ncbi:Lactamase-B domain-containing protein [Fusarium falciforme]|uniref:Lactamase-B domain-containing protein n=1 Tax=Fusarium falciforme TaxID=195108 RepID=UPI002300C4AF|nr:Lactamase-B domain-containing protein [Fusarium falciforme]WAO93377.1 Lactamase-B domain-containing protein [Fusarium falciforme]